MAKPCPLDGRQPTSLKISLRTRLPREALCLARRLSYVGAVLTEQWAATGMRYDEIRSALKSHFQVLLERSKAEIAEHGRLSPLDIASLQNGLAFAKDAIARNSHLSPVETDDELLARFTGLHKVPLIPGTEAHAAFKMEIKKAYRDYCAAVLAHDQSFENFDFLSSDLPMQQSDAPRVLAPKASLNEVSTKFITEEIRAGRWVQRSEDQKRQHIELLKEILGADLPISLVTASEAQHVKEVLLNFPRNRNKTEATRSLSLAEIAALKGHKTMAVRTINTYLQTYNGLFGWAKRNKYVSENVFDGSIVRENKRNEAEARRDAFSEAQITTMLHELLTNEHGLLTRDYQKWGPLIGLYTGARLNEVCQINVADIRQVEGVWCFDFNDEGDDKRLKNEASRRKVPVHSRLLDLGLLAYADAMRSKGQERFFPEFSYSPKEGYGRALGRWFNDRFLVKLGIKSKDLVFHSFRHGMVTALMQAGVEENLVKAIVGHKRQGVTQEHYFKQGYTIKQMHTALERF